MYRIWDCCVITLHVSGVPLTRVAQARIEIPCCWWRVLSAEMGAASPDASGVELRIRVDLTQVAPLRRVFEDLFKQLDERSAAVGSPGGNRAGPPPIASTKPSVQQDVHLQDMREVNSTLNNIRRPLRKRNTTWKGARQVDKQKTRDQAHAQRLMQAIDRAHVRKFGLTAWEADEQSRRQQMTEASTKQDLRSMIKRTMNDVKRRTSNAAALIGVNRLVKAKRQSKIDSFQHLIMRTICPCAHEVLHPTSRFRLLWNGAIMLLVCLSALAVPFQVAFGEDLRDHTLMDYWSSVDLFFDSIFMVDVWVNFRTGYMKDGVVVTDTGMIAERYLKGSFTIDVISSFPLSLFISDEGGGSFTRLLRIVRLSKLLRLVRFSHYFKVLTEFTDIDPSIIRLLSVFMGTVIVCHWTGCLWYLVSYDYLRTDDLGNPRPKADNATEAQTLDYPMNMIQV